MLACLCLGLTKDHGFLIEKYVFDQTEVNEHFGGKLSEEVKIRLGTSFNREAKEN